MKHMNRPTLGMIFQPSRTLVTALCAAGLALTACSSADDASKSNDASTNAQSSEQQSSQNESTKEDTGEQAKKLAETYGKFLDDQDAGDYALVHIDDSGHPALLFREHNPSEIRSIQVHYPNDDLTDTTLLKHEFADGAASVGGSRTRLLATADHNGLLQKSWQSISPDRKIERYVLADSTMHKDGQEWNFNSAAIPAEYSDAAQAIIWSEVSERALIDALADGHDNPMETLRSADNYPHFVAGAYTSDPFAKAVHEAFINQWVETGKTDVVVEAYSTVTGQNYSMSCDGGAVDGTVVCAGGNNASVTISDEARSEGSGGSTGAGGGSQPAPSQSTGAANQLTGTVRVMTGYETIQLRGPKDLNQHDPLGNDKFKILFFDTPQQFPAFSAGHVKMIPTTASYVVLPEESPYQDGERGTLDLDSNQCTLPSDASLPRGIRCYSKNT